jgi:DNA-binding NarL/FixJ family response regulator
MTPTRVFRHKRRDTSLQRNEGMTVNANGLTPREHEVARLVARGWTNKEVARELGVTDGTVKLHMHKILQKLGEKHRYALYSGVRRTSHLEGQS